jgi:hypothetical protein
MDCKTARLLFDFARPLSCELEKGEAERLQEHLADCSECSSLFRVERKVDEYFGQTMRTVAIPEGLANRLKTKVNLERRRWYRQRIWLPSAAVAIAVVLIGVFLGLRTSRPLPGVNLEKVYHDNISRNLSAQSVNEWFYDTYKVKTTAPPQFNYLCLIHRDLAQFEGKQVPLLVFFSDRELARVYILSAKDFDLKAIREAKPTGYPVEVLPSNDPNLIYVVIFSGGQLDRFLTRSQDAST